MSRWDAIGHVDIAFIRCGFCQRIFAAHLGRKFFCSSKCRREWAMQFPQGTPFPYEHDNE